VRSRKESAKQLIICWWEVSLYVCICIKRINAHMYMHNIYVKYMNVTLSIHTLKNSRMCMHIHTRAHTRTHKIHASAHINKKNSSCFTHIYKTLSHMLIQTDSRTPSKPSPSPVECPLHEFVFLRGGSAVIVSLTIHRGREGERVCIGCCENRRALQVLMS